MVSVVSCHLIPRMGFRFFSFLIFRTPFELNTGTRCAIVNLFEASVGFCIVSFMCSLTCMLVGSRICVQACLQDIKSIFVMHVDPLSKLKNSETLVLERCIDAIKLHERVNRYFLSKLNSFHCLNIFASSLPADSYTAWQK